MKYQLMIACTVILIVNFASCAEKKPPVVSNVPNTNEIKVAAEPTPAPTRTPLPPNVREDADGNLIKADGWPIQKIIPKETRQRRETGKTEKGRTVIYNVRSITPEGHPVAESASPYSENGAYENFYEWRIRWLGELSGHDGRIFCYQYEATLFTKNMGPEGAVATATSYRLCDYDGDGKYESNGSGYGFPIPDWVKTLPGDPAAVNSNANY